MAYSRSLVHRDFDWDWPSSRLFDQHFGLGVNDDDYFMSAPYYRSRDYSYLPLARRASRPSAPLLRQLSSGGLSEIRTDADKFQVLLDVSHFAPEEITVKTVDDQVVVQANHEEKVDEHGYVSRQFTRRYILPAGVEVDSVKSTLSGDGVLTVEAPRKRPQRAVGTNEKPVPISVIGGPSTAGKEIPVQKEEKEKETEQKK